MAFLPRRVTLSQAANAALGFRGEDEDVAMAAPAPPTPRRGIPGLPGAAADEPEIDVLGALGRGIESILPTPPAGGFSREEYDPVYAEREGKAAARDAQATQAATVAASARTDPAGGTRQGGAATPTATKASGAARAAMRLAVPGRGMVDYDPDDPTISEAFAQQRGGKPDFMAHRDRTARQPAMERGDPTLSVGPPGAATGRPSWTESAVPEASQIANWDQYLKGREAEQATFETGMAETRARGVEATMRAERPFYAQELEAKGKLAAAAVKAESEGTARQQIMNIVSGAAEQLNSMRSQPAYRALPPAEQRALEDQIWDQARLTLSALTRTNLYPRPDPYSALLGLAPQAPAPTEEKS